MYTFALLVSALGLAAAAPSNNVARQAAVASVDRHVGPGCTGTTCNIAGSGDLQLGCNKVTDQCKQSVKLNYANLGCTVTAYINDSCSSKNKFAVLDPKIECYDLGPDQILSYLVVC